MTARTRYSQVTMSKRILITSFTFPPQRNGVSHVVEAHATGLARLGHDITVVTGLYPGESPSEVWSGVKVRRFATQGSGQWVLGGYTGDIGGYQDFIASFTGDMIISHCWQIWSTDLALQVFDRVKCPKILVSHGVSAATIRKTIKGIILRLAWQPYLVKMRKMLNKFDHVVVLSEQKNRKDFYDHKLMHRYNYKQHSVIPNGVDENRFSLAPSLGARFRAGIGIGNNKMILYVSNFNVRKNQQAAIEVFLESALTDAVLVLIGSAFNDYSRHLQAIAFQAINERRIIILEKQSMEDISAAYCAADIFLCTSTWELQPLVILEAMAANKPFISTDVGCVRDMPGGIIVENKLEMVKAVQCIMNDERRSSQLGSQGRMAIEACYTWERVVQQYDDLINNICSATNAKS